MSTNETRTTQKRYDRQASLYDLKELPMELFGFKKWRKRFWQSVKPGRVLEIGIGTGKNLPFHPVGARIVAIDISPRMLERASLKVQREGRDVDLVLADAQSLPFRDGAFDTAAATFVFCSVPDAVRGLKEANRVVKPGSGGVDLLEHVRSGWAAAGWVMDRVNPMVVRMMGANINRDTVGNVSEAGIQIDDVESRAFGIVKLIHGQAAASAAARSKPEAARHVA